MKRRLIFAALLCLLSPLGAHAGRSVGPRPPGSLRPERLRCEDEARPLAVESDHPALSWIVTAVDPRLRGLRQKAYQIQAATTLASLHSRKPDLWDSGLVGSAQTLQVPYGGRPVPPGAAAFWRVRVWDQDGKASGFSPAAEWERGLRPQDWTAQWISRHAPAGKMDRERFAGEPAPLLRKDFRLRGHARARLYISGLGYYEAYVNGKKAGDQVLDPAWTDYRKRVPYRALDVTDLLKQGPNALGVMLGSGWWDPLPLRLFSRFNLRDVLPAGEPRVIAELRLKYADGSTETVRTDPTWRTTDGPILRNSVYLGEEYDARREPQGWGSPGFRDQSWTPAVRSAEPVGPLYPQDSPPIRCTRVLKTVRVTEPKPGVHIFDLGQNFAGWARMRVRGPAGQRVQLRYGELLNADGTLNPMTSVTGQIKNSRPNADAGGPATAVQTDAYTLRGEGEEVYTPRFTFHGFRYVEVTGYPGQPTAAAIEGLRLNADVETVGEFSCSNPLFNRIQEMCRWTFLSNLFSVQSDCPHREKLGYGGDIVATSDAFMLNFDMARFYRKVARDFADDQRANGGFTETAPYVGIADQGLGEGAGPVEWGTAHPLLVWQLYQYYGDRRLLAEQYPAAQRWLALLQSKATDGILVNGIGDHETLAPKDLAVSGTAYYFQNAELLARMAKALGRDADHEEYVHLAAVIRDAFNRRFMKADGQIGAGTQACQSLALGLGLLNGSAHQSALAYLESQVAAKDGHLDTGIFGTKHLLDVLPADRACQVVNQRAFPGWGYMLENGGTTLWEHWAFSDNTFSHNHPMFGSVSEWLIGRLGGILPAEDAVGFSKVRISPDIPGAEDVGKAPLEWVKASYNSPRGMVRSAWRIRHDANGFGGVNHHLDFQVSIPPNTEAEVEVPCDDPRRVELVEAAKARRLEPGPGIRTIVSNKGAVRLLLGSGAYHFRSTLRGNHSPF